MYLHKQYKNAKPYYYYVISPSKHTIGYHTNCVIVFPLNSFLYELGAPVAVRGSGEGLLETGMNVTRRQGAGGVEGTGFTKGSAMAALDHPHRPTCLKCRGLERGDSWLCTLPKLGALRSKVEPGLLNPRQQC